MKSTFELWGRLKVYQVVGNTRTLLMDEYNTIVNAGKLLVLDILNGDSNSHMHQMAIGNGNVPNIAPLVTDTALANQIDIATFTAVTKDSVNRTMEYRAVFSSGTFSPGDFDPEEINEAALIFDCGTMFARKAFSARPFLIADSISLAFDWTVGVA